MAWMDRRVGTWLVATVVGLVVGHGCGSDEGVPEGRFACGDGSCEIGTQLCIIATADGCTSCMDLPAPCEDDQACGCLDTVDTTMWAYPCGAPPTCDDEGDGLVVECPADQWGCG